MHVGSERSFSIFSGVGENSSGGLRGLSYLRLWQVSEAGKISEGIQEVKQVLMKLTLSLPFFSHTFVKPLFLSAFTEYSAMGQTLEAGDRVEDTQTNNNNKPDVCPGQVFSPGSRKHKFRAE